MEIANKLLLLISVLFFAVLLIDVIISLVKLKTLGSQISSYRNKISIISLLSSVMWFMATIINSLNFKETSNAIYVVIAIFNALTGIYFLLPLFVKIQLREKGMYFGYNALYWNKVKTYSWEDNKIEIIEERALFKYKYRKRHLFSLTTPADQMIKTIAERTKKWIL